MPSFSFDTCYGDESRLKYIQDAVSQIITISKVNSLNCQAVLFLSINLCLLFHLHPHPPEYFLWLSPLLLEISEGGFLFFYHNLKTESRPLTLPPCWEPKIRRPGVANPKMEHTLHSDSTTVKNLSQCFTSPPKHLKISYKRQNTSYVYI